LRFGVRVKAWLRSHLDLVDAVFAAVLTVVSVAGLAYDFAGLVFRVPNVWAVVLAVLSTAPLAVRRRYPVTVSVVAIGAFMATGFWDFSSLVGALTTILMIYTVAGAHRDDLESWWPDRPNDRSVLVQVHGGSEVREAPRTPPPSIEHLCERRLC
jgi:hypothetical protein